MSGAEKFILFASDRAGSVAPFSMDLRTGMPRQLAETQQLEISSLQLSSNGRQAYFIDGGALTELSVQNRRMQVLEENVGGFCAGSGVTDYAFIREGKLFHAATGKRAWADGVTRVWQMRPGFPGCLFERRGGLLCFTSFQNVSQRSIQLASGRFHDPCWSPDGRSILLLRDVPSKAGNDVEIHEIDPAAGPPSERMIARTSRYAAFSPNSDATVFVGATASKAQPSVMILVRSVGRELTLCEHRAADPGCVNPSFSHDNRRVYFASDFQGRPAIYAVNVERLVEPAAG